ncbi:MAG: serine phosphatase RsbU (regulator of sigma subunit) [Saprospiraceae bacterium]|jgi:serine phosphatase RsbU (regulator of sigma subunit)
MSTSLGLLAQNKAIDSLTVLLSKSTTTEKEIKLKCQLSQQLTEIGEFEKGGKMANDALTAAEKADNIQGIGLAYYSLARLNQYLGDWSKALTYHYLALPIFEEFDDREEQAWTYLNIGISLHAQNNATGAINNHERALSIFKELNLSQGIAYSYLNLGLALNIKKKYSQAIQQLLNARLICKEIGDDRGVGYVLSSIAEIHENTGEYEKAITGILECIKIREKENDKMDMSFCYSNLGSIYLKQGLPKKAEEALKTGEKLGLEVKARPFLKSIYLTWSKLDSLNKNYIEAYHHFKLYSHYDKLINSEKSQRKASELQHSYEKDRKEKELVSMKKEQELKNVVVAKDQRNLLIGLVAIGIILVIVIAFYISVSKRASRIRKQKNIITAQKERGDEQHKNIRDSIVYAQKIQHALLTSTEYIQAHLKKDFFILYQPKDIVSGDYYWAQKHNDSFYLTTADCTGHGVPGAFMSLLNISIMNEIITGKNITSPAQILNEQKEQIIKSLSSKSGDESRDGMDCVVCKFDLKNDMLTFSAANSSLWLIRDHEITKYKGDKMPVGKYTDNDNDFTEQVISLQKGDLIYTFTDGITDQFGGKKDKKFKPKKLVELLLKVHELPLDEQNLIIMRTLETWIGNREQTDDMLIIGVKY